MVCQPPRRLRRTRPYWKLTKRESQPTSSAFSHAKQVRLMKSVTFECKSDMNIAWQCTLRYILAMLYIRSILSEPELVIAES